MAYFLVESVVSRELELLWPNMKALLLLLGRRSLETKPLPPILGRRSLERKGA
jgi:hypothetical protein